MKRLLYLVFLILLLPTFVSAANEPAERAYKEWLNKNWMTKHVKDLDSLVRFQLFIHCQPMRLRVNRFDFMQGSLPDLREDDVVYIVRNNLAAHNLNGTKKDKAELEVKIQLNGPVFSVTMRLKKIIFEPSSNYIAWAPTWDRTLIGEHKGNSLIVLGAVKIMTDGFLESYREANESCLKK